MSLVEKFSNDPRSLGSINFKKIKPKWWKKTYSDIVLDHFKSSNGEDNGVKIDTVKNAILDRLRKERPELDQLSYFPRIEPYVVDFGAHLFHTIINESKESDGDQDKDLIMKRFETADVEKDGNLLCAWATFEPAEGDYRQHYVLKHKKKSVYCCISCGNTKYIVRYEPMTDQYIKAEGGEEGAKKARDRLVQAFVAAEPSKWLDNFMEKKLLEAGVWDVNSPPVGMAL